jgi:hypothetical protein
MVMSDPSRPQWQQTQAQMVLDGAFFFFPLLPESLLFEGIFAEALVRFWDSVTGCGLDTEEPPANLAVNASKNIESVEPQQGWRFNWIGKVFRWPMSVVMRRTRL